MTALIHDAMPGAHTPVIKCDLHVVLVTACAQLHNAASGDAGIRRPKSPFAQIMRALARCATTLSQAALDMGGIFQTTGVCGPIDLAGSFRKRSIVPT
jgi:hypothetical protein